MQSSCFLYAVTALLCDKSSDRCRLPKRRTRKKGAPLGLFSCYLVAAAAAATTAVVIAASAAAGVAAAIAATANQKQDDNPPDVAAEASVIPTHKKVPPCFLEFSEL